MRLKILFVAGLATGYVLGAKAGRDKYEELKTKATQAWEDPRVHKVVSDAQGFVQDAAPVIQARVTDATAAAADTAKVAGQKVAEGAATLRERIMEAVDAVLEKVGQGDDPSRDGSDRS
ncbi:MAG: YtxH domain-containing protein [Terrimesophilobacter sp.]